MRRRSLLAMALSAIASGCTGATEVPPAVVRKPPAPPDLVVGRLANLLTVVDLEWLVLIRPESLAAVTWLKPALSRILRDERLELNARVTGVDLRKVPEIAIAGYGGNVIAELVRHRGNPLAAERKFRARLTSDEIRTDHGHQLTSVFGQIGGSPQGFVSVGPDVVGFQYGGTRKKGPARIAILYAQGKLGDVPTALGDPTLGPLEAALNAQAPPPLQVYLPGPFDGETARGARGLLAGADAVGIALAPTSRRTMQLAVLIGGDYGQGADLDQAVTFLAAAWSDLAQSDLGHLLSLHEPRTAAEASPHATGLALTAELDADKLFRGLSAATIDSIDDIMK